VEETRVVVNAGGDVARSAVHELAEVEEVGVNEGKKLTHCLLVCGGG
jgi:hypothetical protein